MSLVTKSDCKDIAVSYRYSYSFVHKTCLFEAGACLSAPDADSTITHAIVSTYTIKMKEIMVGILFKVATNVLLL